MNIKSLMSIFCTLVVTASVAQADEGLHFSEDNCFYRHVREAIDINSERRSTYAPVAREQAGFRAGVDAFNTSNSMILMERLLLPAAIYFDRKARPYKDLGIPLFCEDLIEMTETPSFKPTISEVPGAKFDIDISAKANTLSSYIDDEDFYMVDSILADLIDYLEQDMHQYCLSRHFFESMLRTVRLIPYYLEHFEELGGESVTGLDSPLPLLKRYLKLHLRGFSWMERIDKRAYRLQSIGVPMVCRDVPPIPYSGDFNYR